MRILDGDKFILSCAVTGAIHVPTMSQHLPITPEEIADAAVDAADAGASIVHLHVRDPVTGEPVNDLNLFREVIAQIHARSDVIIQPTTGGAPTSAVVDRIKVVPEFEPEMASCNMGSINFGLYPIARKYDSFLHDWERDYLESTRDLVFRNSFEELESVLQTFDEHDTVPELECYDVGHLYNVRHMMDRDLIHAPVHLQFVMGILGGIGADAENLSHMVRVSEKLFGDQYSFSVIGAGRSEYKRAVQSLDLGGHVRVGLEDNLYIGPGEQATSNAQLVEKAVSLAHSLTGRSPADPRVTREFLGLKGKEGLRI
jgi:uncharacterized protein (DUF849 family)